MRSGLRIAMVAACPFPLGRGTPIRIQREAEALAARGHEVHIVTYFLGNAEPVDQLRVHRTPRLPLYSTTSPGPTYRKLLALDPMLVVTLMRRLGAHSFDLIHAHHYEGLVVARAARAFRKIPLIYDAHTMLASELSFFRLGLPRRFTVGLGRHLDRRLPMLADYVISVTERIRNDLVERGVVAPGRISVVGNGVELELFNPDAQPSWQADGIKRIMFIGNMAPYQGIDILLAAFAATVRQRRDVRLVVVTDWDFASYARIASQLGVEDLIELVPAPPFIELPTLLSTAHIAVNPRVTADGAPVKLLNYLAAGKPVVSFEGSAPGLTHGQTAWLVRGGDPVAFGDGILALLEAPERAHALGRKARSFVEQHHCWPVVAARIEDVYRTVLALR